MQKDVHGAYCSTATTPTQYMVYNACRYRYQYTLLYMFFLEIERYCVAVRMRSVKCTPNWSSSTHKTEACLIEDRRRI